MPAEALWENAWTSRLLQSCCETGAHTIKSYLDRKSFVASCWAPEALSWRSCRKTMLLHQLYTVCQPMPYTRLKGLSRMRPSRCVRVLVFSTQSMASIGMQTLMVALVSDGVFSGLRASFATQLSSMAIASALDKSNLPFSNKL